MKNPEPHLLLSACLSPVEALAERFAPISLAEMDGVRLMNRTDTKFVLRADDMPGLLAALRTDYRCLSLDGQRLCGYETLYFDTPGLHLYHEHRAGRLNRYKIRQRRYVASGLTFTEVKRKTNKGRTVKTRIETSEGVRPDFDETSRQFLSEQTPLDPDALRPTLWVRYTRLTLVGRATAERTAERLTFDFDLTFSDGTRRLSYPQIVVAEVKQDAFQASPFRALMKQHRLREGALSKYCLGLISLDHTLPQNRFKARFRRLQTLLTQA